MPHYKFLDDAKTAITALFKDDTAERETARFDLEEIRDLAEDYLAALDDADNKHNYQR